jgi:general secretion pathway protein H
MRLSLNLRRRYFEAPVGNWQQMRRVVRAPAGGVKTRSSAGMTLLELIIALALIAVLAVSAAPMLGKGMGTIDQRAAAQRVTATLKHARNVAVSQRIEAAVTFNIKTLVVTAPDVAPYTLPKGVALDITTIEKEKVDDDTAGIRFYPDGGSTGGRVTLKKGDRTLRIDVDWLTGRVKVEEDNAS